MSWSPPPEDASADMHVLRLCSVFEPEAAFFDGRAARFDPVGGMQNHTAALSRCLDGLGVRQTVITAILSGRRGTTQLGRLGTVRRVGVPITRLRQLWAITAIRHVLRVQDPVDLVHVHQGEDVATLLLGLLATAVHRCPLVVTLHCSVRHTVTGKSARSWLLRVVGGAVERLALGRAAAVVVLVPRTARAMREDGIADDRVHVLPSGFEPSLFTSASRDAFPELPRPRVGYVGRLAAQKRPELLVEAFGRMRSPAHLVLVGDGPMRPAVAAAIAHSPVRDQITLTGFIPHNQVPAALASLDVLALPSAYEEMGSVLVEAMAAGLPVVASRVGGIPDVVCEGETGLLVPPNDVAALAAALDNLLDDAGRRQRYGAQARRHAEQYAWPALALRVADLYGEVSARQDQSLR